MGSSPQFPMKPRPILALLVLFLVAAPAPARPGTQEPPDPDFERGTVFPSYGAFRGALAAATEIPDPAARATRLDELFSLLEAAGQVPYAQGRKAAFLYRGPASSVAFPGDHTGWNPGAAPAARLADSDVWLYETELIADSRVDYKVVRDGSWILDPRNPLQVWSGFGPNSELRMPRYRYPHETVRRPGSPSGALGPWIHIDSTALGYTVRFRVYTPSGDGLAELPAVYFTDGHEYLADHLGSAVVVLDNLIAARRLRPVLAVFVDPRDPVTGENRRMEQYVGNPAFASFVAQELVPSVDLTWPTDPHPGARTILGTSLGGLFSAYLGALHPEVFENVAIQSPAFHAWPSIYSLYAGNAALADQLDVWMESGTIHDGQGGPLMADVLAAHGYDHVFREVHEGHSWGHWRALLDEGLLHLVGAP